MEKKLIRILELDSNKEKSVTRTQIRTRRRRMSRVKGYIKEWRGQMRRRIEVQKEKR